MSLRHEFYESETHAIITIYDRGVDPANVSVVFQPRKLSYHNRDKSLVLEPLRGYIDTSQCNYIVGRVKVEIRLTKRVQGRWGALTGDETPTQLLQPSPAPAPTAAPAKPRKNWDSLTSQILTSDKDPSPSDDPNAGGDNAVNSFFQKIFADADEDTRRAMMKSYQESGGTTLSTNWEEVKKGSVPVKPPEGSEWKKWN